MKTEVSVIVPIYNSKTFLRECIDSILAQKKVEIEVLLVDSSTEKSCSAICDEYEKKDARIQVIRQKNDGISNARNSGMESATGTYLMFVDSDDYLPQSDCIKKLFDCIEAAGTDLVVGEYARLWNGNLLPAASHDAFSQDEPSGMDFRFKGFFTVGSLSYVWNKLYRRDFLIQHSITFARYDYAEDKLFNLVCYLNDARYSFLSETIYVYRKNDASVSFQYRPNSEQGWIRLASQLKDELMCAKKQEQMDLVGNILFFACFFDAKMEYVFGDRKQKKVRMMLRRYASYPLVRQQFIECVKGNTTRGVSSLMWRVMIRGFCLGMTLHMYTLIAFGIRCLIEWKIDERLSDTGKRDRKHDKAISD